MKVWEMIEELLDLEQDMEIMIDNVSLEEKNSIINDMINEIVNVMENNDIISLTDILEYEIKPVFENMELYIDKILDTIIQSS